MEVSQDVTDRVKPAIRHPDTGKIYTVNRGQDHLAILKKYPELQPERAKLYNHTGFLDPKTGNFHTRDEIGKDSTDLMTGPQRFRALGSESHVLTVEGASGVKTWHAASYNPDTELYTVHNSYDTYDECPKNSQWILNTGRGREEYITGIDPTWPDLGWYIPPGRVIFPTSESEQYRYNNGRIQVRDNSIEVYDMDGNYLIITADKSIRDILNGASSHLTFRSRT
jgi:hypothetical protein